MAWVSMFRLYAVVATLLFALCPSIGAAQTYILSQDEVITTSGITCGRINGVWISGSLKKGKFAPLKNQIKILTRKIKKADIDQKERLTKKLKGLQKKIKVRNKICADAGLGNSGVGTPEPVATSTPLPTNMPEPNPSEIPVATSIVSPTPSTGGTPEPTSTEVPAATSTVVPTPSTGMASIEEQLEGAKDPEKAVQYIASAIERGDEASLKLFFGNQEDIKYILSLPLPIRIQLSTDIQTSAAEVPTESINTKTYSFVIRMYDGSTRTSKFCLIKTSSDRWQVLIW
jgi:hypothetical protein